LAITTAMVRDIQQDSSTRLLVQQQRN